MNIFVLDDDIQMCAQYHTDKHVVKMIAEYSQILSTVISLTCDITVGVSDQDLKEFLTTYKNVKTTTIKKTHEHHPCVKWCMESMNNFKWLLQLLDALHDEWQYRYGHPKDKLHASYYKLISGFREPTLAYKGLTPFARCTDGVEGKTAVEAYRAYYNSHKQHLHNWKNREKPSWIKEN